jgi:hypothetical protein
VTGLVALGLALGLAGSAVAPPRADVARAAPLAIDRRTQGVAALGGGALFGVTSLVAFTAGLDAERELRAARHTRAEANDIMLRRGVAAWVAWPSALLAAAGTGAGVLLLNLPEDEPAPADQGGHR